MKTCRDCGKTKLDEEMVPKKNWCRDCRSAWMREYNQKPERVADRAIRRPAWNKKRLDELLAWYDKQKDHPCTDCEQAYHPAIMEWDHKPGFEKISSVPQVLYITKSKKKVEAEIAKCDLVCANAIKCERIIEDWRRMVIRCDLKQNVSLHDSGWGQP